MSFDLVTSMLSREEALKKEYRWMARKWIVDHGVKRLDKEHRDTETARYTSTKKLFVGLHGAYSRRMVWMDLCLAEFG